jgi:hypothetical protein
VFVSKSNLESFFPPSVVDEHAELPNIFLSPLPKMLLLKVRMTMEQVSMDIPK